MVKSIELMLENTDSIVIDAQHIGCFAVEDISTNIRRVGGSIRNMKYAGLVAIEISRDANKEHCEFGCSEYKTTVFDRLLAHNDIVAIYLAKKSGKKDVVYVDWCDVDANPYRNPYQKTRVGKNGNLYILIHKNKTVEGHFGEEAMSSENWWLA